MTRPEARWVYIAAANILIFGRLSGFLPHLGFWMVPLGILLLSKDFLMLRRPTLRALGATRLWWDQRRAGMGERP